MDEKKPIEPVYSTERIETTSVQCPPEATTTPETSAKERSSQFAEQSQRSQFAAFLDFTRNGGYSWLADFAHFLKRTKRVWLSLAGAALGLMVMVTLVNDVAAWAKNARERRHELAVATVTPDRLIARCGPPAEDTTKEVYPILMRTMTYQPNADTTLVVAFSRTAEEKSDWVFLSMKDQNDAGTYDTPEAKIAALPCLDSKK
jgi:hypothetical protein